MLYFQFLFLQVLKLEKKIIVIVFGVGNWGNVYGNYVFKYFDQLDIVGVVELIEICNDCFVSQYDISDSQCFVIWEYVFEQFKFVDVVIIIILDDFYYGLVMVVLVMGYDFLLEKLIV